MKKLLLILSFTMTSVIFAQELPPVNQPKELIGGRFSEGVNTKLTPGEIQKFLPWAQSARKVLTKALADAKIMPITERSNFIKGEVERVVLKSGKKRYQTFMRYSLNRGLFLVDELIAETGIIEGKGVLPAVKGNLENQLDILMRAIKVGLQFYESDLAYQKRIEAGESAVEIANAKFGFALAKEFAAASVNIFDASAQYRVLYKTLEMFNWDLSQDRQSRDYSETIWSVYKTLEKLPEQASANDQMNIKNTRKLIRLKNEVLVANTQSGATIKVNKKASKTIEKCNGSYCVGRNVFFNDAIRMISHVSSTGQVILKSTKYYHQAVTTTERISILVDKCHKDFCIGNEVLFSDSIRTISHLDNTGRVRLKPTKHYNQAYTTTKKIEKLL